MVKILVVMVLCFNCTQIFSETLGNPDAPKGGIFYYNLSVQPVSLNPLSSSDQYASSVHAYTNEGLATVNADTYEFEPWIAKEWKISDDNLTFDFFLRDDVYWHDGKKLTAEDVKFSFDAIVDKDNKYSTAHLKPYFENFTSCEVVGKNHVRFKAKKKYFKNFSVLASAGFLALIPKHIYENPSEKQEKNLNKTVIGSGPYKLKELKKGKYLDLERNPKWWGWKYKEAQGMYNFDKIRMRFIKDDAVAMQRLEKGDIDYYALKPEMYVRQTTGAKWGKTLLKHKVENKSPKSYLFIGWNNKHPILKSKMVRKALYHLIDRDKMIEKYEYNMSLPATGPWYQQSPYANPDVKPVSFSVKKAMEILKAEGWKDTDGDLVLDKVIDGKKTPLRITVLEPSKDFKKYLVTYQQDAKKAGVDIQVKIIEWNSFIKLLDERNFEAARLGWGGGSVDNDPKQIWHSESHQNQGSNFIGYSNSEVDSLIDQGREVMDKEKRKKMWQKVYKLIAEDHPYAFLFNKKYDLYATNKRVKMVKPTYNFGVGEDYWWLAK